MRFPFDRKRAVQVAAELLRRDGGQMDVIRLAKLMYFVDRKSLERHGLPIIGGDYVNMPHGPVCLSAYEQANEPLLDWERHFERVGHRVVLRQDPGREELSPADEAILDEISQLHEGVNDFELVDLAHQLAEWSPPGPQDLDDHGRRRAPLPAEAILQALGKSANEIDAIRAEAAAAWELSELFPERA